MAGDIRLPAQSFRLAAVIVHALMITIRIYIRKWAPTVYLCPSIQRLGENDWKALAELRTFTDNNSHYVRIPPMYVCICNPVTESEVRGCVSRGACTLPELQAQLGVALQCGQCASVALRP